jgi:hypothetical protein
MMFVGDKGRILAGFRGENPVLIPAGKMKDVAAQKPGAAAAGGNSVWTAAFKNDTQSPGSFLYAGPVTETILLGAVALRANKKVEYDSANMKITNVPEANKFLTREYRQGWEL